MLFFTFVWKEDRGSLGKKRFPLFQAKVRCFRGRPPFPEWLDSISLVATPSLSPPLVRLPPNFLILLSLTILSRLQSPLQFLPPFSPHFSFQCFFFPPICCNRALCQQAGLSSWPSLAHPPCGSCQRVACGQESNRRSFPTLCFGALLGKKARISRTSSPPRSWNDELLHIVVMGIWFSWVASECERRGCRSSGHTRANDSLRWPLNEKSCQQYQVKKKYVNYLDVFN